MICYTLSGYIIFSLRKLKFYQGRGPHIRSGVRGPDNVNALFEISEREKGLKRNNK